MTDYSEYLPISATQAGAGTAGILPAPAAGTFHEVVFAGWDVDVAGAGTWLIETSGNVEIFGGPTIVAKSNSMPCGRIIVPESETLDLVVATAGTVTAHVLYRTRKQPPR